MDGRLVNITIWMVSVRHKIGLVRLSATPALSFPQQVIVLATMYGKQGLAMPVKAERWAEVRTGSD